MNEFDIQKKPTTTDEEQVISIAEYIYILLDEWRTFILPILISIIGAGVYLLLVVPTYNAIGVIQVSASSLAGANALTELTGVSQPSPVETELEILRSRRLVGEAARKLGLGLVQKVPKFTMDLSVTLDGASPISEELVALRQTVCDLTVADWHNAPLLGVFRLERPDKMIIKIGGHPPKSVAVGGNFDNHGIRFKINEIHKNLPPNKDIAVAILPDDQLTQSVLDTLGLDTIGGRKETNLVRINAKSVDRTLAKNLVNALMEEYMVFALNWRTERAKLSSSFIEGQLDAIRKSLDSTENEIQQFLEQSGAVQLPEQAKSLIAGSASLDLELRKIRIQEKLMSQVAYKIKKSTKKGTPVPLSGDFLFDDQLLGNAIGRLNELTLKRESMLSEMTATHPEVIRVSDEITRVRGQILELVKASRDRIRQRRQNIKKALDNIQTDLSAFPDKERQMAVLRRNQEVSQELYTYLMTKLEESRIVEASTTIDKRIIDRATTPFKKSSPARLTAILLALLVGICFGIVLVFARRSLDPRIRDEDEAKNIAGLTSYGVVPNLVYLLGKCTRGDFLQKIWESPKGPAAESFRTLRTNVEFAQMEDNPIRIIQITSCEASEGKSTVIANLATAMRKSGHKVIIIDLDMRRPMQNSIWGTPLTPGISEYLAKNVDLKIHKDEKLKIDMVSAGNEPPETQRLLNSKRLSKLINELKGKYDYVFLDAPPLLVADSLILSKVSDMLLFVVRPGVCRRTSLKLAKINYSRMELLKGLVINGVASRRGGYYHYYRGSYYGSSTKDTQEE